MDQASTTGRFDIAEIAAAFPATAKTLLLDRYLTDTPHASARVFRVYQPTPPHYHANSDEYLYVFSGRGTFWMEDPANQAEFGPGQLLSSAAGSCTLCPTCWRVRSSFCPSTHRAATQRTSSSSTRRTARPRASFKRVAPDQGTDGLAGTCHIMPPTVLPRCLLMPRASTPY